LRSPLRTANLPNSTSAPGKFLGGEIEKGSEIERVYPLEVDITRGGGEKHSKRLNDGLQMSLTKEVGILYI